MTGSCVEGISKMPNIASFGPSIDGTAIADIVIVEEVGGPDTDVIRAGDGDDVVIADHAVVFTDASATNATIATALNIDQADYWSILPNQDVTNPATPYTSILGTGAGAFDVYAVTVGAGATITLDIDYGYSGNGLGGPSFDAQLVLTDAGGNELAANDDGADGGFGSASPLDSFLSYTVATASIYYVRVQQFDEAQIGAGDTYLLNVSVTGHANTGSATFDDDTVFGEGGSDLLQGGDGNDLLQGGDGADAAYGGAGNDIYVDEADGFNDIFYGGAGNDTLQVVANGLTTTFFDESGNDTISAANSTLGWTINLAGGGGGSTGAGLNYAAGLIENAIGSAFDDTLTAISGGSILRGGAGNDTLNGGSGDDLLEGSAGTDNIKGNAGFDIASYASASSSVAVSLEIQTFQFQDTGGAGSDLLTSIEGLEGSAFGDLLIGDSGANMLSGGDGIDFLAGGLGSDTLHGGAGADTFYGLTYLANAAADVSNEYFFGDAGDDMFTIMSNGGLVTIADSSGVDTISATASPGGWTIDADAGTGQSSGTGAVAFTAGEIEKLIGSTSGDTLLAFAGGSFLMGYEGADSLVGRGGNDMLDGGDGSDTITGGGGIDLITGGNGSDSLDGGAGDDTLDGGGDNDSIIGGTGIDTLSYASAQAGVTVSLVLTTAQNTLGAGVDTITQVENLTGSTSGDVLSGNSGDNRIDGGIGDDLIEGLGGNDQLIGGTGALDEVSYAHATARVIVSLAKTVAQNTLGAGIDTLSGFESLTGTAFVDVLTGSAGADTLSGLAGNDTLTGGAGVDTLLGGAGNDILADVSTGGNLLDGGTGTDIASFAGAVAGVTVDLTAGDGAYNTGGAGIVDFKSIEGVIGSDFGDVIVFDAGDNSLIGGLGDDQLRDAAGNDLFDGGAGFDTASYDFATAGVTVNLISQSAQNTVGAGIDTLHSIEAVIGSDFADTLTGNQFANTLLGLDGNDLLTGGLGNDTLDGGLGIDTASYATAAEAVKLSLANPAFQSTISAGSDQLVAIENLTGSAFDDQLTGDGGNNVLVGNAGNDVLLGGQGNDTLNGGAGIDTTSYAGLAAAVTVSLVLTTAQPTGGGGIDTLLSIENVTGTSFDDVLTGSSQVNIIAGGTGNDMIDGGSSNDTIDGGAGNDTLKGSNGDDLITAGSGNDGIDGGAGIDTLIYAVTSAGVTVNLGLTVAQAVGGGQGIDTIVNVENVSGSGFGDTLTGNALANSLTGGAGRDMLTGGAGNDRFVYLAAGDSGAGANADRILDFGAGDILDLSAIDADANSVGTDEAFTHVAAFSGVAGQFTLAFDGGSNMTTLLADADGNGAADFSILFTGDVTTLTSTWVL